MSDPKVRLEYLRGELRAERIGTEELIELQSLVEHIDPGDVELLEAAGVPEGQKVSGGISDLIKALQIFLKYGDPHRPTHCEHDYMQICGIDPADVSAEDVLALDELGFFVDEENDPCFMSFRFGSA